MGPVLNKHEWELLLKIGAKPLSTSTVPAEPGHAQLVGVILVIWVV